MFTLCYGVVAGDMETSIKWMESEDMDGCRGAVQIMSCAEDMECNVAMSNMEMRIHLREKVAGQSYGRFHEGNECIVTVAAEGAEETTTFVGEGAVTGAECGWNNLVPVFVSGIGGFMIGVIVVLGFLYLFKQKIGKM